MHHGGDMIEARRERETTGDIGKEERRTWAKKEHQGRIEEIKKGRQNIWENLTKTKWQGSYKKAQLKWSKY